MVGPCRWVVLALVLLSTKLWAAGLAVHFPASPQEAGRTLRVVVSSTQTYPSLAGLDLSPWAPWLVLDQRGDVQPTRAGGQSLVVWLVPRASALGRVRLPALSLGALHGGGQVITIGPARGVKGGEVIDVHFSPPSGRACLRQQLIYTVSVLSRHRYLQLSSEPGDRDGVVSLAIPQQVSRIGSGEHRRYRHTAGWLLFPSRTGRQTLQLPAVRYGRDGVTTHRFYPPPVVLQVSPLPDYLPPTVALGQVELRGMERPWSLVRSGDLQTRRFSVVTHGVPARWWHPPPVVAGDNGVQLFEAIPQLHSHIDATGLTVSYQYALPLAVSGTGWHALHAASRLYAFDPMSGKMQALDLRVELPLSLYGWQEWGLAILLSALSWYGGRHLWRRSQRRYHWCRDYRLALAGLDAAADPKALRQVLALVARAEAWPANLSLGQWQRRWQGVRPRDSLDNGLRGLAEGLYGTTPEYPAGLAEELGRALRKRLGWWRWACEPGLKRS